MATSNIIGFARDFDDGAPIISTPFPLGSEQNGQISFPGQIRFLGNTARRLASSESGSRGYFPGANVVVADYDNPFLELQLEGLGLTQATTGRLTFNYVAPNVADGQLSVEIFDVQGRSIVSQALPRTNGTYEIPSLVSPQDYAPDITVEFNGIPARIRIGGVLREFGIDNIQLETDTTPPPPPPPPNQPPETNIPPVIIAAAGTAAQLTGLGGTDADGTVTQFIITSLPSQGTLSLGSGGTPVTLNQQITFDQINNLFFQADANFTGTSFTYAAIDNQDAQDLSPATVTLNPTNPPVTPGAPTVSITATDSIATEPDSTGANGNPGEFTITRTGSAAQPLVVNYEITGTATNGTDYEIITIPASVTIPSGQNSIRIPIIPLQDTLVEVPPETVILTLSPSSSYSIQNGAGSSTVSISDNVITPPPPTGPNEIRGTSGNDSIGATSSSGVTGVPGSVATDFNDTITGGGGSDTLTGLGGSDLFIFSAPSDFGDTINVNAGDTIQLPALGSSAVESGSYGLSFVAGIDFATISGFPSGAYYIYNTDTRQLLYDADGVDFPSPPGVPGVAVLVATINGSPTPIFTLV